MSVFLLSMPSRALFPAVPIWAGVRGLSFAGVLGEHQPALMTNAIAPYSSSVSGSTVQR
jgi:hypothetical protein